MHIQSYLYHLNKTGTHNMKRLDATMWTICILLAFIAGYFSYRIYAVLPLILALGFGVLWFKNKDHFTLKFHWPIIMGVGGLLILSLASLTWTEFFGLSQKRIIKFLPVLLGSIFPLCILSCNKTLPKKLARYALGAWSIGIIFILIDTFAGTPIYGLVHQVDGPLLPQLNRYAIVLLIGYVFICHHAPRITWVALLLPMAAFLWKTESQSVQLTVILLILLVCCWSFLKNYMSFIFGLGITITTLGFPFLAKWMFINRPEEIGGLLAKGAPYSRLEIWNGLSTLIFAQPWLGYGIGVTRSLELPIEHIYWQDETILHPHNYALQIWLEFGLVGVVAFLTWMWWALLKLKMFSLPDQKLAYTLILSIFGINLTAYGLWQGWWLGLMLLIWISFYIFRPSKFKLDNE